LNTNEIATQNFKCLKGITNDPKLWYRRLGHIYTHTMHELVSKDLLKGLTALDYKQSPTCDTCIRGKQVRSIFKPKKMVSMSRPCELLHIDLCGPIREQSIRGKSYILVTVDDYSRLTWVDFLKDKCEALKPFSRRCKEMQTQLNLPPVSIRSDHGREFDQLSFDYFSEKYGITHNFSAPRTPQQNGMVERKNRTIEYYAYRKWIN
jgi:transposase InsO family protein